MKNKEFKLLIESFNNFLMSESDAKSDETQKLFDAVPSEFKKYVNRDIGWINGLAWLKEPHVSLEDKAHFEKLAEEFKCKVEDFLVINVDVFSDSVEYDGLKPGPFLGSFNSKTRSFEIKGDFLIGERYTKTIIVVPKLSEKVSAKSQDTEVDRKNKLK